MKPDMSFLENIFERLGQRAGEPVLREIRDGKVKSASGGELLGMVQEARNFLNARGLKKKDRCALLGSNSIRWVALDLAMMAEGIVVVPLYSRQAPAELVAMLKDSWPARIFCSNAKLSAEITKQWPGAAHITLFDSVFAGQTANPAPVAHLARFRCAHDYLHFRDFGRIQGRDVECRERELHAGMHECAAGSAYEPARYTGAR